MAASERITEAQLVALSRLALLTFAPTLLYKRACNLRTPPARLKLLVAKHLASVENPGGRAPRYAITDSGRGILAYHIERYGWDPATERYGVWTSPFPAPGPPPTQEPPRC